MHNPPVMDRFPNKGPIIRSFGVFSLFWSWTNYWTNIQVDVVWLRRFDDSTTLQSFVSRLPSLHYICIWKLACGFFNCESTAKPQCAHVFTWEVNTLFMSEVNASAGLADLIGWGKCFSVCVKNQLILNAAELKPKTKHGAGFSEDFLEINSSSPGQNCRYFADNILKCFFLNEKVRFLTKISLKFVPKVQLIITQQIMAWRRIGERPLYEPMLIREGETSDAYMRQQTKHYWLR